MVQGKWPVERANAAGDAKDEMQLPSHSVDYTDWLVTKGAGLTPCAGGGGPTTSREKRPEQNYLLSVWRRGVWETLPPGFGISVSPTKKWYLNKTNNHVVKDKIRVYRGRTLPWKTLINPAVLLMETPGRGV